jgi:hypothetical protein
MTSNSSIKQYADQLSDIYMRIEDAKVEAAALIDAAKEAGLEAREIKALRKVAKEMVMMSDKLAAKYADEQQLDMFRDLVRIRQRKGLEGRTMQEAAE